MKTYVVNVGPISNSLSDPLFFFGTGFWGEGIDSYEELKELIRKYWKDKEGRTRPFKLSFSLGVNVAKAQEIGNQQAAKGEDVNMISVLTPLKDDPFRDKSLYYSPWGFKEHKDSRWLLAENDDVDHVTIFTEQRLFEVLPKIGINLK